MSEEVIQMLPVEDGDCIFVELPCDDGRVFRILIDCGRVKHWETVLEPFFRKLESDGKRLDVLVLTHIDSDHIGGAIPLLESEYAKLIDDIWYNGLEQVIGSKDAAPGQNKSAYNKIIAHHQHNRLPIRAEISAKEGLTVSGCIRKRQLPQNRISGGKAITGQTESFSPFSDIYIDFLLPDDAALGKLQRIFDNKLWEMRHKGPIVICDECENAFENLMLDDIDTSVRSENIAFQKNDISQIENWARKKATRDTSNTNDSSIAFCIRYYDKVFLFAGDSSADSLITALDNWSNQTGKNRFFDVVKLPHHGSYKNCADLLDKIDGKVFLISTDGSRHSHPDKETIAKIVTRPSEGERLLLYNYQNDAYKLFDDSETHKKYHFRQKVQQF